MANISIKVISDNVCPFCYLGKKRLEKAIELYKKTAPGGADDRFTVTWHPFYLDPTLPPVGRPLEEVMTRKFGSVERVRAIHERMAATGRQEGINFTWQGRVGNTRDSHRLVQLARAKGGPSEANMAQAQDRLISSLFRAYFEEGADITSADALVAAAERGGLDAAEARAWLEQGKGGAEVDEEVERAYQRGVHGVPHFIINDDIEISGAQEAGTFLAELVRAKRAAEGKGAKGAPSASTDPSMTC
ncbi:hypothetical protein RB595_007155 [Gaeumannomyces hyphopodioides]